MAGTMGRLIEAGCVLCRELCSDFVLDPIGQNMVQAACNADCRQETTL